MATPKICQFLLATPKVCQFPEQKSANYSEESIFHNFFPFCTCTFVCRLSEHAKCSAKKIAAKIDSQAKRFSKIELFEQNVNWFKLGISHMIKIGFQSFNKVRHPCHNFSICPFSVCLPSSFKDGTLN